MNVVSRYNSIAHIYSLVGDNVVNVEEMYMFLNSNLKRRLCREAVRPQGVERSLPVIDRHGIIRCSDCFAPLDCRYYNAGYHSSCRCSTCNRIVLPVLSTISLICRDTRTFWSDYGPEHSKATLTSAIDYHYRMEGVHIPPNIPITSISNESGRNKLVSRNQGGNGVFVSERTGVSVQGGAVQIIEARCAVCASKVIQRQDIGNGFLYCINPNCRESSSEKSKHAIPMYIASKKPLWLIEYIYWMYNNGLVGASPND